MVAVDGVGAETIKFDFGTMVVSTMQVKVLSTPAL